MQEDLQMLSRISTGEWLRSTAARFQALRPGDLVNVLVGARMRTKPPITLTGTTSYWGIAGNKDSRRKTFRVTPLDARSTNLRLIEGGSVSTRTLSSKSLMQIVRMKDDPR
jgi:hypothetical protein